MRIYMARRLLAHKIKTKEYLFFIFCLPLKVKMADQPKNAIDSDQFAIDSCLLDQDDTTVDSFAPEKNIWLETMAEIVKKEKKDMADDTVAKKRMRSSALSKTVLSGNENLADETELYSFFEQDGVEPEEAVENHDAEKERNFTRQDSQTEASHHNLSHVFSSSVICALQSYVDERVSDSIDDFQRQWEQTPYMAFFATEKKYKSLVAQVAHDFKRFFFENWARELRSQRPTCSLSERVELNRQLQKRFDYYERQIEAHCEKIESDLAFHLRSIKNVLDDAFNEAKWQFQSDSTSLINDLTQRMDQMEQRQAELLEKIDMLEERLKAN